MSKKMQPPLKIRRLDVPKIVIASSLPKTALEEAIEDNDVAKVEELINGGVDPEESTSWGKYPLILCIQLKRLEIAKLLIEVGANTTQPDPNESSPLECAISRGSLEMVQLLLDNGADLTMYEGLVSAIDANDLEIVSELIRRGADVNRPNSKSQFPIMLAVQRGSWEIIKPWLETGANVNVVNRNSNIPILKRASASTAKRNCEILRLLLENGASVNVVDGNGKTPLLIYAQSPDRDYNIVRLLVGKGANLNVADSDRQPLLMSYAISKNRNCDILKLFVENGADLNCVDRSGDTPVMKSVRLKNIPALNYLITRKADLDVKSSGNETALSLALSNTDFRSFKLLIESGADPKLASEAIEAMARTNPDFAAYMSRVEATKKSPAKGLPQLTGFEVGFK